MLCCTAWFALSGCSTVGSAVAGSVAGKNVDLSGYFMLGKVETVNPETAAPEGKLVIGRVNYKSRLVAVDKDKQIPTAGAFRAIHTVSLFGTEETVIEYDFTAATPDSAAKICQVWEQQKNSAAAVIADKYKE